MCLALDIDVTIHFYVAEQFEIQRWKALGWYYKNYLKKWGGGEIPSLFLNKNVFQVHIDARWVKESALSSTTLWASQIASFGWHHYLV